MRPRQSKEFLKGLSSKLWEWEGGKKCLMLVATTPETIGITIKVFGVW